MDIQQKIIEEIKRNRISTTEIADCMDKTGALANIYPLNRRHFRVGKIFWAYGYKESNWELHEQIREMPEKCILLVEPIECSGRAMFGSLVSKHLMLYKRAAGIVVLGRLRDAPHLIKENWPIWFEGPTPLGCFNRKNEELPDPELLRERHAYYDNAIAVCDDSGVVVISETFQNKEFLEKLDFIEEQENIWFDCIDRLKWDTFDTVCLKKYKNQEK